MTQRLAADVHRLKIFNGGVTALVPGRIKLLTLAVMAALLGWPASGAGCGTCRRTWRGMLPRPIADRPPGRGLPQVAQRLGGRGWRTALSGRTLATAWPVQGRTGHAAAFPGPARAPPARAGGLPGECDRAAAGRVGGCAAEVDLAGGGRVAADVQREGDRGHRTNG